MLIAKIRDVLKKIKEKEEKGYSATEYLSSLNTRLDQINQKNDKLSVLLMSIALTFFLFKQSSVSSINLGLVEIKDISIILSIIPVVFSALMLYLIVLNIHKKELNLTAIVVVNYFFGEGEYLEFPTLPGRNIIPFSFWREISRINDEDLGCLGKILILPVYFIYVVPLWFNYYSVKLSIIFLWKTGILAKLSLFANLWLIMYTLFFYGIFIYLTYKSKDIITYFGIGAGGI